MSFSAPIKEVLLLEDRAYVTRRALLQLKAGVNTLEFPGVTPILSDKSLTVEAEGLKVADVRLSREVEQDEVHHTELVRLESELSRLRDAEIDIRDQLENLGRLKLERNSEIEEDVSWGRVETEEWRAGAKMLWEQQLELGRRTLETSEQIRQLREQKARLNSQREGEIRLTGLLKATLEAPDSGEFEVTIRYCVPCACWRPYHRAELWDQGLTWVGQATVWQNTGEDWSEVEVSFSTERTAQTTELPPLNADILAVRTKDKEVVLETREQEVSQAGEAGSTVVTEIAGIEDGGETFSLKALAPLSLESSGEPCRIDLFRFDTECQVKRLARPELLPSVILRSHQHNSHDLPLLPGPVDLVKQGRFLGTGWLDYAAPGSKFHLDWGPDSELTLKRTHDSKEEKEKLLKGWVKTEKRVQLFLSNLSGQEKSVEITERIPVSESRDLKVEINRTETTDSIKPDENGFVHWTVELQPNERKKLNLSYSLQRRKSVQLT
jgi:uncharacterized protein (TIGR02231 family)